MLSLYLQKRQLRRSDSTMYLKRPFSRNGLCLETRLVRIFGVNLDLKCQALLDTISVKCNQPFESVQLLLKHHCYQACINSERLDNLCNLV